MVWHANSPIHQELVAQLNPQFQYQRSTRYFSFFLMEYCQRLLLVTICRLTSCVRPKLMMPNSSSPFGPRKPVWGSLKHSSAPNLKLLPSLQARSRTTTQPPRYRFSRSRWKFASLLLLLLTKASSYEYQSVTISDHFTSNEARPCGDPIESLSLARHSKVTTVQETVWSTQTAQS